MARKSRYAILPEAARANVPGYRAGLYRRLSEEDGDNEEQNSLGNQKKIVQDYLEGKEDIEIIETYTDNGYTGMNYDRPDYIRMMADLQENRINCIIVKDISRLGRHFVLTSELVERTLPEMGVRLICVNDNYDSLDKLSNTAALMLPLKMVMNDSYAKDISVKIRSSISAKMHTGEFLPANGSIPYGYLRNTQGVTYDIDPETAPIVDRIFRMRAQGDGFNTIARALNSEGVPSPGKLRFLRGITRADKYEDAVWIRGTIRKITQDEVYIGKRIHGRLKRDRIGRDKKACPKEDWLIIENAHPPIIDKELFDNVQEVNKKELERLASYQQRTRPEKDYRKILYKKVYCADCGRLMHATFGYSRKRGTPGRINYVCGNYITTNRLHCSRHNIRQESLMTAVMNALQNMVRACIDAEAMAQELQNAPETMRFQKKARNELTALRIKRENQDAKMEQLLFDLTSGLLDREDYEYLKRKYTEEMVLLKQREKQVTEQISQLDSALVRTRKWLSALKRYQCFSEITREMMEMFVEKIEVKSDGTVIVRTAFADPFQPLMEYKQQIDREGGSALAGRTA